MNAFLAYIFLLLITFQYKFISGIVILFKFKITVPLIINTARLL